MSEQDTWMERFHGAIPEELTSDAARVLLDLIEEDPGRFLEALEALSLSGIEEKEIDANPT